MNKKANILMTFFLLFSFTTILAQERIHKVDINESKVTWLGKKVTGEHMGTIAISEGTLTLKDNKLASAKVVIDMTTITCTDLENEEYNQKLVGHLKSDDFFGVKDHPKATLVVKKLEPIAKAVKTEPNYKFTGALTIKGITNDVTSTVRIDQKNGKITAVGKIIFDRSKYEVKYNSGSFFENLGDKLIYDDVEVGFELTAN